MLLILMRFSVTLTIILMLRKAREEFVLDIAVKVTAKSRVIKFTIINTAQTSTVTEELA